MTSFHVGSLLAMSMWLANGCAHSPRVPVVDACQIAHGAGTSATVRVPFELVDGRIYVQASVNGNGPYRFAVDTGASGMGRADARLVQALDLRMSGQVLNSDGVHVATNDTTRLDSVDLGGLVRRDIDVIARDYGKGKSEAQRFDGILGREFFADGLLVIDYPNKLLAFTTVAGIPPDAPNSIGYARPFRVPVSIAGQRVTGHLDTGANVTAVLPKSLYDAIQATALSGAAKGQLTNGAIDTSRTTVAGTLEVGEARLTNPEVRVSEKFPELLIGAHVLQHYLLAIDQRSQRVAVCEKPR